MFVQVAKLWDTTSLQIIAAMRENGQRILRAQSFQTLRGNEWLDSDVSDSGEKLFVNIPSIFVYSNRVLSCVRTTDFVSAQKQIN